MYVLRQAMRFVIKYDFTGRVLACVIAIRG